MLVPPGKRSNDTFNHPPIVSTIQFPPNQFTFAACLKDIAGGDDLLREGGRRALKREFSRDTFVFIAYLLGHESRPGAFLGIYGKSASCVSLRIRGVDPAFRSRTWPTHPGTPCSPSCVRRCSRKQIRLLTGHPSFVHRGRRQRCLTVIGDQTEMLSPRSPILIEGKRVDKNARERKRDEWKDSAGIVGKSW